jgi:hypothetical protein
MQHAELQVNFPGRGPEAECRRVRRYCGALFAGLL